MSRCERMRHPGWPEWPAFRLILVRDDGSQVAVWVAEDEAALEHALQRAFGEARRDRMQAAHATRGAPARLREQAAESSRRAWAMRNAFAPLRHAYALTAHKSQGSTFETAIVDLADLTRMRSAWQFNRALYVAATRAAQHLAIVA